MELQKSPVHIWAESKNIPVETSIKNFSNPQSPVPSPDYVVVASYGAIIPDDILARAKFINIHPSLLPKYRGPSPMLTALYNGDSQTGVCIMDVAHDVDAGGIYACEKIAIGENDTIRDLESAVSDISAKMLIKFLENPTESRPQIGAPTFTKKFAKEDAIIDWKKTPRQIHNQIRSIGGRTKINGIDVKILRSSVVPDELAIMTVQPSGKKPMSWKDFVNGQRGEINIGK
jgi:methionyl-tRNA formyltransferase